jgi:methionyl-tRNA synthetase
MTRHLVTSALPYANGPIHLGHVAGAYLPADLYVRGLRQMGEEVLFVCGADEHGVAITIGAEKAKQGYDEYVEHWRGDIKKTFDSLGIAFDTWSGTSVCPDHEETTQEFFRLLDDQGYLIRREIEQLYCTKDEMYLADRYVEGTCYNCGAENARGDECPDCGTWIETLRLKEPRCKLCGGPPERRNTSHWFLDLPALRDKKIAKWIEDHDWKSNVSAFIKGLLKDAPERAITRDMKWGVPVPEDRAEGISGKVLYVWFDAPIGYISFTKEWARKQGRPDDWKLWWQNDETHLTHFIGKDNIPFHCLVFPSMLWGTGQNYILPHAVPANEFYSMAGGKFSTSEGRTFDLEEYLKEIDPEVVRCYLTATLPETADAEFKKEDLVTFNNSSLASNLGNLGSRVLKFIAKNFDSQIPELAPEHEADLDKLLFECSASCEDPGKDLLAFRFRRSLEDVLALATAANVFMQRCEPWKTNKTDPVLAGSQLNTLCEWIALLARWLAPFAPGKAQELWQQLGAAGEVSQGGWPKVPSAENSQWRSGLGGRALGELGTLFPRIEAPVAEKK